MSLVSIVGIGSTKQDPYKETAAAHDGWNGAAAIGCKNAIEKCTKVQCSFWDLSPSSALMYESNRVALSQLYRYTMAALQGCHCTAYFLTIGWLVYRIGAFNAMYVEERTSEYSRPSYTWFDPPKRLKKVTVDLAKTMSMPLELTAANDARRFLLRWIKMQKVRKVEKLLKDIPCLHHVSFIRDSTPSLFESRHHPNSRSPFHNQYKYTPFDANATSSRCS